MDKPHVPHSLGTNGTRHVTHSAGTKYALDITHSVGSFICLLRSQLSFFFKLYTFHHSDFSACLRPLPSPRLLSYCDLMCHRFILLANFEVCYTLYVFIGFSRCVTFCYMWSDHIYITISTQYICAKRQNIMMVRQIKSKKPSQAKPSQSVNWGRRLSRSAS